MLVVLISVPVIDATGVICDTPPMNPIPVGTDQVYRVPAGITPLVPSTGVTLKLTPLQVTVVIGVTIAVGSTVTVRVNGKLVPQGVGIQHARKQENENIKRPSRKLKLYVAYSRLNRRCLRSIR